MQRFGMNALGRRVEAGSLARGSKVEARMAGGNRVEAVGPKAYSLNPTPYSSQPMAAAKPFGRYGPLESHEVRQPDVTGQSLADQVKRTRQMLREMTPEKVLEVIEFHKGLNLFEALALAKEEGKLIIPNDIHDRILNERTDMQYLEQNYPVWTGTLVIYEKLDMPFGEHIWVQSDMFDDSISFTVPEHFQGKVNCALVIEHPDFELVYLGQNKYELKVSDEQNVHQIEQFPKINGQYKPNAETGIPHGKQVTELEKTRYLWRSDDAYLGLLGRGYRNGDSERRVVVAVDDWSGVSGVALVPLAFAPKMSDSHD